MWLWYSRSDISFFLGVNKWKWICHDGVGCEVFGYLFFFAVFLVTRFDIKVWIARFAGLNFKIVNQTKESGVCVNCSVVCGDFCSSVSNGQPFWRTQFCQRGTLHPTFLADHVVATPEPFDHSSHTWRSCRK